MSASPPVISAGPSSSGWSKPSKMIITSLATVMLTTVVLAVFLSNSPPVPTVSNVAGSTELTATDDPGVPGEPGVPSEMPWAVSTEMDSTKCMGPLRPISQNPCLNLQGSMPGPVQRSKRFKDMMQGNDRSCKTSCDCKATQKPFYPITKRQVWQGMAGMQTSYRIAKTPDEQMSNGPSYCIQGDDMGFWRAASQCCDYIPAGSSCTEYGACGPKNYCDFDNVLSSKGSCTACPKYDAWGNSCAEHGGNCQNCALDGSMVVCGKHTTAQVVCNAQLITNKAAKFMNCMYPRTDCFADAIYSLENSRCLLYGECKLQFGYPRCLSFASMMDEALGTVKGKWMAKKSLGPFSVWAKTDVTGGIQVESNFGPAVRNADIKFTLKDVKFTAQMGVAFEYDANTRKYKTIENLGDSMTLLTRTGFVGPTPVVVKISLTPVAKIDMTASASAGFNFNYTYTKTWRIKDGTGIWYNKGGFQHNIELEDDAPELIGNTGITGSATAAMQISIGPKLTVAVNAFPLSVMFGGYLNVQGKASMNTQTSCVDSSIKAGVGVEVTFSSKIPDPAEAAQTACVAGIDYVAKKCGKGCDCLNKAFGGKGLKKDGRAVCKKAGDIVRSYEPKWLQTYEKAKQTGKLYTEPFMKSVTGKNFCRRVSA